MTIRWLAIAVMLGGLNAKAQHAVPENLQPYTACHFDDGLTVSDLTPLAPGAPSRNVDTLAGQRPIAITAGERIMFSYANTDFFAKATVEELPASSYAAEKKDLIDNFNYVLDSSKEDQRNFTLKPHLNGFEIYGQDRGTLEGSVLGLYLFFDDAKHIATTLYFLNQEPAQRKFETIEAYRRLRDRFLERFTTCVSVSTD